MSSFSEEGLANHRQADRKRDGMLIPPGRKAFLSFPPMNWCPKRRNEAKTRKQNTDPRHQTQGLNTEVTEGRAAGGFLTLWKINSFSALLMFRILNFG
jgi:hypothetical protein